MTRCVSKGDSRIVNTVRRPGTEVRHRREPLVVLVEEVWSGNRRETLSRTG